MTIESSTSVLYKPTFSLPTPLTDEKSFPLLTKHRESNRPFSYTSGVIQRLSIFCLALLFISGCASTHQISDEFNSKKSPEVFKSHRTVVLFLIDGLSLPMITASVDNGTAKNISKFFLPHSTSEIKKVRTTFPSLTFPSINSILTLTPVSGHQVIGNHLWLNEKIVNFESVGSWDEMYELTKGKTIFSSFKNKNQSTVSLSYPFGKDSTVHVHESLDAGIEYFTADYQDIDKNLIQSAQTLFEKTPVAQWPEFVFIHLIGFDATEHTFGPNSKEAKQYLKFLDRRLAGLFKTLGRAENEHEVVSLLTSDHGFADTPNFFDMGEFLENWKHKSRTAVDSRVTGIYFNRTWDEVQKQELRTNLLSLASTEWVAFSEKEKIHLLSKNSNASIELQKQDCGADSYALRFSKNDGLGEFLCPDNFNSISGSITQNYIVSALAEYFLADKAPDLIVIPKQNFSYRKNILGEHGGLTADEMITPLLMRNAKSPKTKNLILSYDILKFAVPPNTPAATAGL